MRNFFDEHLDIVLIVSFILMLACLFAGFVALDIRMCNQIGLAMDLPERWGFWTGCMISPEEGTWVPLDNYRWFGED